MDGPHQSSEVPQGRAQQHQKPQPQQEQQQIQQGKQPQLHGQHQRRHRPHCEQRAQHHQNRVQQLRCRSHIFRQHQEEKRGNNDAVLQLTCEGTATPILRQQRSFADKAPDAAAPEARKRLLARSRSTPWSLDEKQPSKVVQGSEEIVPYQERFRRAASPEAAAAGGERTRIGFPASQRLRRFNSYGSVDSSNRFGYTGSVQTNTSGFNRRYVCCSSQSTHRGGWTAGSNQNGSWCFNNNITTNEYSSTCGTYSASKGTQASSRLRALYKKSVSFDCTSDLDSKSGVCNSRKDCGYPKTLCQQSVVQLECDPKHTEQQRQAAEGCDWNSANEVLCFCASEVRHLQPDRVHGDIETAQDAYSDEFFPAYSKLQTQQQQHQQRQKYVSRRKPQEQKVLQRQQQAQQHPRQQQHNEQPTVERQENACSPERASANNLPSELVPSQQALLQEQPPLGEDRSSQDSSRSTREILHSATQWLRPFALHDRQNQKPHQEQRHQQQTRPQQHETQDTQPVPNQKADCLSRTCYSLQWPLPPSVLYCQQLQQLQAGSSSFYKKDVTPCPDPLLQRLLLGAPDKLCVSHQQTYSKSDGPPCLLLHRLPAAQRCFVRDTCEAFEKLVCITGQNASSFSSLSAPQSAISPPSATPPPPTGEGDFCGSDIGKDEKQRLSTRVTVPFNPPACTAAAAAAASCRTYLATHATRIDKHSVAALANNEGYGVPATQVSKDDWTAAVRSHAQRRNHVSHLPEAPLPQNMRDLATGSVCLNQAENTVECRSNTFGDKNATAATRHAGGSEPSSQAAAADSSEADAASGLAGDTTTLVVSGTTSSACISSAEETADRKSTPATSAAPLPQTSCSAGCPSSAVATVLSSSTATQSEHAVTYEGEHVECSQWRSSRSELGLYGHPAQCTARRSPAPSRFLLAFPPKDKSLLLPVGAPLVAATCGTTNGGVDNKDHDYIARQYEFIFPDHLLAVIAPPRTSANFSHSICATGPPSAPAGVATVDPASSAPTAAAVATAATGSSGCDPAEPVAQSAAAGVLVKPVAQLEHQSSLCLDPAAQPITKGGGCKANANAGVLSTVHAASELPSSPLLQREDFCENGSTGDRLQKPGTASGTAGPPMYVTALPKTGRAAATTEKALNSTHRGMLQEAMLEYEGDRESRGNPRTERGSRWRQRQEKDLLHEDVHVRSSTSVSEAHVKNAVIELPVKRERDAAAGEHTIEYDVSEQQGRLGTIVCSPKGAVESKKSSTRPHFDKKGGTVAHQAVDGQHQGANACAWLYRARREVKVEGPGRMEEETEAEKRQRNGNAGTEAAAVLQEELQAKERVVGSCAAGPEAVHSQRTIAAMTALLELQGRAKSLPAKTFSFLKYRHLGARALGRNASGRLARIAHADANAVILRAAQRAQDKGGSRAAKATADSMFGKTAQPCACPSVHANQHGHDIHQDDMRTTQPRNWHCTHDRGLELNLTKTSLTGSIVPAAGEETGEKASEIDVEDACVQNPCAECVLREQPHRIQRKNSRSKQEAYGCELYDTRAVSCVPCSSPNSSPHSGSNSCDSITGSGCSRGGHRLHYYQVLRLLGRGTFGHVYECLQYDAYSGEAVAAVAVKVVKNDEAYTRSAMQEIAILRQLNGTCCKYSCNCKTAPAALGKGEGDTSCSSRIGAASGKPGTMSGGGGVEGRDNYPVYSDQERQWAQHQNGAGQQPRQPDRHEQDSVQDRQQQADADLGKRRLVQLLDDFTHCGHKCLVFELLQTDLYQLLKKYRFSGFPLRAVKQVCRELLQGLAHLKRVGVVHCDLKPENILVRYSGFLPAQQEHPHTQWCQGALQQQHDFVQDHLPLQQHQPPVLQSPQQQELQALEQRQRRCSWEAVSAGEETRQQQELAAVNISHAATPVSAILPPTSRTPVSTSASASPEDLPTEDKIIEGDGVCHGSFSSLSEKAVTASVYAAGTVSSKATAATTASDAPLPLEVCSLTSAPIRSPQPPKYGSPSPKNEKCLPSLPMLHAISHSAACNAEACLPLPKRRADGSLPCSTTLACRASLGCTTPVFWQQPVTTHTAAPSHVSSACPVPVVRSSSYSAGNMLSTKCIPPLACAKTNRIAQSTPGVCAVAPAPTATTTALPPDTRNRIQNAVRSVTNSAAAPGVYATAATSSAAHLYISVKLVDFSSAYPLPSCPQPADPAAIEVLEQEHAPHPAAPYLYAQSRFYGAPEVMLGVRYMKKLDVWAVGCVAAELYSGKPLLPGATDYDQMRRLVALRGTPPEWMLRVGRRTSLYFARDRRQHKQQRLAEEVEEDDQRRLQQKDEEGKRQEKHQTRRQQDHEEGHLEVHEDQQEQQQLNQRRRQQQNQQQPDDDALVHQAGARSCKGMEDERAEKVVGHEEELEQQQEPSLCEANLHGVTPVAEGASQVNLLNGSHKVAGGKGAAQAFVRRERWGALSAAPCGLPRRQIQAWWRRILIAVSSRSTVEKKPHQDKYCRRPSIPQHQRQQAAKSAHQQRQQPTGIAEQQADVAPVIQGVQRQQPEKCCGATAARTSQQQQVIQHAGTQRQRGESCFSSTVQGQWNEAFQETYPQTYVPLVHEHSAGDVKQRSAAQACAENRGRRRGSGSHVNPIKTCEGEEGRTQAACRIEKEDSRSGSHTRSVRAAGRCTQDVPGKAGLRSEATCRHVAADRNRAANSMKEASGETNATLTCNEGTKQCTEGNTDAATGECCCPAEGSGWRLKTAQEVGEGTSSREETPRGGPVLRSLQELLTMRKRREQLCRLQMEQRRTILTNDGEPTEQVSVPGYWWPMTDEGFSCKGPAACTHPLELEVASCIFPSQTSEEANMQSGSPVETATPSYAASDACAKSAEEACGQLCMSSRNCLLQLHTGSSVPRKEAPASKDACLLSSSCLNSARQGTAKTLEFSPQGSRSRAARLPSRGSKSGCTQAAHLKRDSTKDGVVNFALESGAGKPQGESTDTLGSGVEAGRTEAATATARKYSLENGNSTRSAHGCLLRKSEVPQAVSGELEKTKTVKSKKSPITDEDDRKFSCHLVQAFPCSKQAAFTGAASSVLHDGRSRDSAGAPCSGAAPFNSAVPQVPAKGGCAAVASAPTPSCPQRYSPPPRDAAQSPHQAPIAPAAKTTPPQAAVSMRHHLPKRASRFFKKLMKSRTSRHSPSNYSVLYSGSHFAASPAQNTPTDKPECSATPGKRLPPYSASSSPPALPAISTSSLPPTAPPVPEVGLHRPSIPSFRSARVTPNSVATQQKTGLGDDTVGGASSHLPPLSGAAVFFAPPAAAAPSASLRVSSFNGNESSFPRSSACIQISSAVSAAGRLHPLRKSGSTPCSAPPAAYSPDERTNAASHSCSAVSAACSSSDSAALCRVPPVDPSSSAGVCTPSAPQDDTVVVLPAASGSPALAASTLPSRVAVSLPNFATASAPAASSTYLDSVPCVSPRGGAAVCPPLRSFCSCSSVVGVANSSSPPFPVNGDELRKDNSILSTASSSTVCTCCSLQYTDAAVVHPRKVADAQVETDAGTVPQEQSENKMPRAAEVLRASSLAVTIPGPTEQAEEERQEQLFLDFLDGMLQVDPFKRYTVEEALRHPFIAEDFSVVSPVAACPPATAEALSAATAELATTAAAHGARTALPAVAVAPRPTPAFPPATEEVNTDSASRAPVRAAAPELQQERKVAVQEEEHRSPTVSGLAVFHSSNIATGCTPPDPAAQDPQVAAGTVSKTATTTVARLLPPGLWPAPRVHGNFQPQKNSSSGDAFTSKLAHPPAPASARRALFSSRSVLCRSSDQPCFPPVALNDAAVLHDAGTTAAAAATLTTPFAGAAAGSTRTLPPSEATTCGAADGGVGAAVAHPISLSNANALAAVDAAAHPAAVTVAAPGAALDSAVYPAGIGVTLLRERAVGEQYRIWSSEHFKEVVKRLREDALRHQQTTAAALKQAGATEEQVAVTSPYAGRKQQQGTPQHHNVCAGRREPEQAHEVVHEKTREGKR